MRKLRTADMEWTNDSNSVTTVHVINSLCYYDYDGYFDEAIERWGWSKALQFDVYNWGEGRCNDSWTHHDGYLNVINGAYTDAEWFG